MLEIQLQGASKRFQYEWIFKNLSLTIHPASKWAIIGSNGSGKSTLIKSISGLNPLSEGKIAYKYQGKEISAEYIYKYLVISAPYLELPEEFTLLELLQFHFKFKSTYNAKLTLDEMMIQMYLGEHKNKLISQFSSGMKQRLKLGICFFSNVPLLLLDEPTSNLDEKGIKWYNNLVNEYGSDRTIIVCSNDSKEYSFCNHHLNVEDFKLKQKL